MGRKKTVPVRNRADEREEIKLTLELLDSFHDTGVSLMTRTIYMGSEMDSLEGETGTDAKMAERFIKNLHVLETLAPESNIKVISDNCGGDVYHGLAIFDAMLSSPCKIEMIVRGYCMSMSSLILQAASKRVLGRNSGFMIHDGYAGGEGHARTVLKWADETKRLNEWCERVYLKRIQEKHPDFPLEKLRAMLDHDTHLTAEETVALGLADEIG